MFIELTGLHTNKKELMNINFIQAVGEENGKAIIAPSNENRTMYFEESYKQVKEMIKREVAAERGY